MSTIDHKSPLKVLLYLSMLLIIIIFGTASISPPPQVQIETHLSLTDATDAADNWWDNGWPYRLPVDVSGDGIAQINVNFSEQLNTLGLNQGLLDLRSIRVIPYTNNTPQDAIAYAETYSTLLEDAENPVIGWNDSGVYWTVNDGNAEADSSRASQGNTSLKATVENLVDGYGYPGVELRIAGGDPLTNWIPYETFIYDIWPEVNDTARDQAPDLYSYKLYNACSGSSVTQGGPPMALNQWNHVSISLNPLDSCWPADGLNLSDITRMEFHTRDNVTVNGNSGLWDDGDILTLWFDNLRLVDQDNGTIRWQTQPDISRYYIYFDVLTHEGHPLPELEQTLGQATLTGTAGTAEAGGYYHQIQGASGLADLQVWAAPTVEKILKTMLPPVASAPLRISAAKGEFEAFQLIIQSPNTQSLAVTGSSLSNGEQTISAPTLHRVDYVNITTAGDHFDRFGLWPDPLWPLNNGDSVNFPANENQPLWFTIQVPWDATPGLYQGSITIGNATIPIELEVWNFSLPREIHLVSEWGFGWSSLVEIYGGTRGGVQACYWDVVDDFKQDFINHRLIPKGVAWPAGINYPGGIEYDCDSGLLDPDAWGEWDFTTLGGKYIKGEQNFNDGYGFPAFLGLGPRSNWPPDSLPYSFCNINRDGALGSSAYQAKWTQYLSALNNYLTSDSYDASAYYHIVNEPQTFEDYTIVGQISALTESAAPSLRQLISEQVEPEIYNYPGAKIDIWMPTISTYEPIKSQDRQKNHAEDVWWYYLYGDDPPLPNPILMSHVGLEARLTPWLAWAERVDGLLHYSVTDWSSNPWDTPNVTGRDNGDAFFFYPPRKDGTDLEPCATTEHRLVPSIRWENLRDGMEDYEYLWLLAGGKPQIDTSNEADAHVAELIQSRTLFSRVPTDLANTRTTIAQALGGPTASKSVNLPAVPSGDTITYTLLYTHSGENSTLFVTDQVPTSTLVLTATGPGLQINGQLVSWQLPIANNESVTLNIQASASTIGLAVNTAIFSSTQLLEREASVLVYGSQIYIPLILK